jgi:hypothetical protein
MGLDSRSRLKVDIKITYYNVTAGMQYCVSLMQKGILIEILTFDRIGSSFCVKLMNF